MLIVTLQTSVQGDITYTNDYANADDTPIYGTMIGPSSYYYLEDSSVAGDALDNYRVYMWDYGYPNGTFQMLKWDMGFATDFVRVYPDVEHATVPWDYLQWSLWGSNAPAENSSAWTLLWDPTTSSGTTQATLEAATTNGSFLSAKVYRYGTNLPVGTVLGEAFGDAFTIDFTLADSYQYFGIRGSTIALNNQDPEINAVATIPLPGAVLLGMLGLSVAGVKLRKHA